MSLFDSMQVSTSGLYAQRTRINVISSNIANVHTTRTQEGGPYIRRTTVFGAIPKAKTFLEELNQLNETTDVVKEPKVLSISEDQRAPILKYDPSHPDANEEGYVAFPNIDITEEMVDLIQARRSFEANVVAFNVARGLAQKSLEIGKR
ncbi:MAG: flagellar basal body rod protein FlgC [SAR324 cluster bacterium]|nr:flagellar basal body rod protein FlgC [SAR324 cluster bacterium]